MKRIIALIMSLALLLTAAAAAGENLSSGKYDTMRVGTGAAFNGNFFSGVLGNNISDQDVRKLIHSYSLVHWSGENGAYQFDPRVVSAVVADEESNTFTIALNPGLSYSDGTPITARDYAFSMLLLSSGQLKRAAGESAPLRSIMGWQDYENGVTRGIKGLRVLGDYLMTVTIAPEYTPYFYELKALDIVPYPIAQIAPGCSINDDGTETYIIGEFTDDLLRKNLLDPDTGYMSHPSVTSGAYVLDSYTGEKVSLKLNSRYIGNENGEKPYIPQIEICCMDSDELIPSLASGELDLVVRCARLSQIQAGMSLTVHGDFAMAAYSRNGLGYISFCTENSPTADERVRRALAMCVDKERLIETYLGGYGVSVDGYYGIGQWMYLLANGTMIPGDEEEAAAWSDLNLDGLTVYEFNPEAAGKLLDEAGWNLNAEGGAYQPGEGNIRCSLQDGKVVPLELKMIYPSNSGAGGLMDELFVRNAAQAGMVIDVQEKPLQDLLEMYYSQTERDCDLIMLGSNLNDVFDPSNEFSEDGTHRISGIKDPQLLQLVQDMNQVHPGDIAEYCRRWISFQEYWTEHAVNIPLYSNVYLDFYADFLQNYNPGTNASWTTAVQTAYLSDTPPETEEEADDFDDDDFEID